MEPALFLERIHVMVVITFPDSETQKKALGFLLGRFSAALSEENY
jgi:hypothetical protein